ncbi:hypothetical protein [Mycobacterium simiae]|uniref:hypothetical protein n=1 Tax=Mycobacterium simiae TaxID=1784 RepID=UPI004038A9B9
MTAVDSPEKILSTSTTHVFLQKDASLRHVRELDAAGVSFDPQWSQWAAALGWTALLVPEHLRRDSISSNGAADPAMAPQQLGKTGGTYRGSLLHGGPVGPHR